jgi:hypothetical protein
MGQIKRDADAGDAVRRAPFVTQPGVKPEATKTRSIKLLAEAFHAVFEPGVLHGEVELAQANIEELFGW